MHTLSICYKQSRNNVDYTISGPSIIFTRHHEAGKTRIRGDKLCKKILGYDANALYVCAIGQPMPEAERVCSSEERPKIILNQSTETTI